MKRNTILSAREKACLFIDKIKEILDEDGIWNEVTNGGLCIRDINSDLICCFHLDSDEISTLEFSSWDDLEKEAREEAYYFIATLDKY